jgi:hypothetical protein
MLQADSKNREKIRTLSKPALEPSLRLACCHLRKIVLWGSHCKRAKRRKTKSGSAKASQEMVVVGNLHTCPVFR